MKAKTKTKSKWKKNDMIGWLVMLPTLVLFAFFVWEPLIENVRLSFCTAQRYEITGFAGFDNYQKVLTNPNFMSAFKNTFAYIGWSLVIGFFVPIILGILISETVHFKGFFRTGIYFPNIVPGLATVWIWSYFFTPGKTGVLNILLSKLGIVHFGLVSHGFIWRILAESVRSFMRLQRSMAQASGRESDILHCRASAVLQRPC